MSVTYLLLILGGDYFIMGYELPNPGEILKELRKKENYTQEYVARQLGVEVKTYRSWEIGCLLYTSPRPRDTERSRKPSSA